MRLKNLARFFFFFRSFFRLMVIAQICIHSPLEMIWTFNKLTWSLQLSLYLKPC